MAPMPAIGDVIAALYLGEYQVEDPVAELQTPAFELGLGALRGPGHAAAVDSAVAEGRAGVQHLQRMPGVVLPIGGELQRAAGFQFACEQSRRVGLDEPALVVALLGPRVGEVDQDAVQ